MKMKRQILISLVLLNSILSLNAQIYGTLAGGSGSNNVGIGIPNPQYKFMVQGEIHLNMDYPYIQFNSSYWNAGSFIQTGVTLAEQANGEYMVFHNPTSKGFNFRQGSYNALTILPNGNIGIGIPNPQYKFMVQGEIHLNMDYPYIQFNSSYWNAGSFIQTGVTLAEQANGDYMVFHNPTSKGFNFRQGSYNALTILPNGSIGINTTTPDSRFKLDVEGTIRASEVKVCLQGGCDFVFKSN